MDKIPQELFGLILRWTLRRPSLESSFGYIATERPNLLVPPHGFYRWLPLRLVSRHWNETITSEKHLWSTVIARGPHAREWLMTADRDPLHDFFLSTVFPALTTLVFVSGTANVKPRYNSPVKFEQHNAPALTAISLDARWQLLRAAPQLEEFRFDLGYYKGPDPGWAHGLWYTSVGLTEPVTMAHLRILDFTTNTPYNQLASAWVLERLRLPHAQVIRVEWAGGRTDTSTIFDHLPRTLTDSIPTLRSLVGLHVLSNRPESFTIEGWNADRTHRFIFHCYVGQWYGVSKSILNSLERFVDIIRCPDGPSALKIDGRIVELLTRRAQWAAILRCFPRLTRLSIANTWPNPHRVNNHLEELAEALRERGKPLAELVYIGEPWFDLEIGGRGWRPPGSGARHEWRASTKARTTNGIRVYCCLIWQCKGWDSGIKY
ncbi:uncharacterized protein BXZ73DRAFT_106039 [Epithele typhae]|uniref:uncharacterized protein n=1 Tax=Epithele typhae TaxID=378194 RepID=UPI0020076C8E|nr:uncharacterized protein BXZ73DRAFT_106039 [Epithele typhae]KAH9915972.1 hypothetical protein BXZ73DRAFT_106039 [Epithele typhae]